MQRIIADATSQSMALSNKMIGHILPSHARTDCWLLMLVMMLLLLTDDKTRRV
jgi:hypothetical protein